jgi:cell division protein FtsB
LPGGSRGLGDVYKRQAILISLLVILQGQIWLGKGSVPTVIELENKIKEQNELNAKAKRINGQLNSEVNDLKEGLNTVEERARHELGMVKANEIFVQIEK